MRVRRAFSFAELLLTMTFIALVARIAIPRYHDLKLRATAAAIVGDVHAIRVAAFTHRTEKGSFPPDEATGALPAELVGNLPAGFSFSRPDFDYNWRVWSATNAAGETETLVGITVLVSDPQLATRLVFAAGAGYIPIVTPSQVTFLVTRSS
jgi:hypothetical protein